MKLTAKFNLVLVSVLFVGLLLTGFLSYRIYLPADSQGWNRDQWRAVLAHELSHARRSDPQKQLFVQIVSAVFWCNPLVWWAGRKIRWICKR